MRHLLYAAGLLLCPAVAPAQQTAPATLPLADAIAIAREHNPTYRQAANNRAPAAWAVRGAFSSLLLPSVTASGGMSYAGPGEQTFLSSSFSQSISTVSSYYSLGLNWELSGSTLSQPGLQKAQQHATEADINGAARALETAVTQQYLSVLQARENAGVARKQVERNEEFLKLAHARFDVGQATLIDVRQAQVARGQAQVGLLRAQTLVNVEKLRLFEQLGVTPPVDVEAVQLTDTFSVRAPHWQLNELLAIAEDQNPSLKALRARERAAAWGARAATSSYAPSVSLSAGWSGFTQQFTDVDPLILSGQAAAAGQVAACETNDSIRAGVGLARLGCTGFQWNPSVDEGALRARNSVFPFEFTRQPFQARLSVTLPLFTNFSRTQQVSEARARHRDLEESVRARGLAVQTEVSQAFLTLQATYTAVAIQDTNRAAAAEQLQLATERYRVGSGTFFELLDAQVAALRAEYDFVNAVYDYHKTLATLEAAVGRSLR
ncbi:MAG: TolC family protein [Gemmatimonadetes bacterium]|nr:TolC family protein [Gemmatimonadota bacterium]